MLPRHEAYLRQHAVAPLATEDRQKLVYCAAGSVHRTFHVSRIRLGRSGFLGRLEVRALTSLMTRPCSMRFSSAAWVSRVACFLAISRSCLAKALPRWEIWAFLSCTIWFSEAIV